MTVQPGSPASSASLAGQDARLSTGPLTGPMEHGQVNDIVRLPAGNAAVDAVLSQVYYVGDRIFREARRAAGLQSTVMSDGYGHEPTMLDGLLAETLPGSFAAWERTIDQYLSGASGLGDSLAALRRGVDPKLLLAAAALTFAGAEVARRLAEKSAEDDDDAEDRDEALALTLLLDALPDRGA